MSKKHGRRRKRRRAAAKARRKSHQALLAGVADALTACEKAAIIIQHPVIGVITDHGVVAPAEKGGWVPLPYRAPSRAAHRAT